MRDVPALLRSSAIGIVAAILMALGIANIATRARLHEVEDGVLWVERSEGVTAVEVAPDTAASKAGIARGDVIVAVNGDPVESRAQVLDAERSRRNPPHLHAAASRRSAGARCDARACCAAGIDVFRPGGGWPLHVARRHRRPASTTLRSGDAAFLLAVRRLSARSRFLSTAPRSARLDVLLG